MRLKTFHLLTGKGRWLPTLARSAKEAIQNGRDAGLTPKGIAGAKAPNYKEARK